LRPVGQIDTFVAKELGYKPEELEKYFGAEQVDALGLAIDNIKNGKGFIIGDQTGIGKGRVNAAIIRWAIKQRPSAGVHHREARTSTRICSAT
jgi:hypothetical protein